MVWCRNSVQSKGQQWVWYLLKAIKKKPQPDLEAWDFFKLRFGYSREGLNSVQSHPRGAIVWAWFLLLPHQPPQGGERAPPSALQVQLQTGGRCLQEECGRRGHGQCAGVSTLWDTVERCWCRSAQWCSTGEWGWQLGGRHRKASAF